MRRLIKMSLFVLLFAGLGLFNMGGCGGSGGGEGCDFDFDAFLNGENAQFADSQWDCLDSEDEEFSFQIFEDGTGISTGVGVFTYQRTGCRSLNFQSALGDATVSNIQGSIDSGILTFFQTSSTPELDDLSAGCLLVIF